MWNVKFKSSIITKRLLIICEKGKGSRIQGNIIFIMRKVFRKLVTPINLTRLIIVCFK